MPKNQVSKICMCICDRSPHTAHIKVRFEWNSPLNILCLNSKVQFVSLGESIGYKRLQENNIINETVLNLALKVLISNGLITMNYFSEY